MFLGDFWEVKYGFNPNSWNDAYGDPDGDGLDNISEMQYGSNPNNPDSDGDGMSDKDELDRGSDPMDPDDGDIPAEDLKRFVIELGIRPGSHGTDSPWRLWVGTFTLEQSLEDSAKAFNVLRTGKYVGNIANCNCDLEINQWCYADVTVKENDKAGWGAFALTRHFPLFERHHYFKIYCFKGSGLAMWYPDWSQWATGNWKAGFSTFTWVNGWNNMHYNGIDFIGKRLDISDIHIVSAQFDVEGRKKDFPAPPLISRTIYPDDTPEAVEQKLLRIPIKISDNIAAMDAQYKFEVKIRQEWADGTDGQPKPSQPLKVWLDAARTQEITLPATFTKGVDVIPFEIFVGRVNDGWAKLELGLIPDKVQDHSGDNTPTEKLEVIPMTGVQFGSELAIAKDTLNVTNVLEIDSRDRMFHARIGAPEGINNLSFTVKNNTTSQDFGSFTVRSASGGTSYIYESEDSIFSEDEMNLEENGALAEYIKRQGVVIIRDTNDPDVYHAYGIFDDVCQTTIINSLGDN